MFALHPELFPAERRAAILRGVIQLGMTPFEARLAGGAFSYKVMPDATRWPADIDPYKVMWAQSTAPDASRIWMVFQTDSQFPGPGRVEFRVYFEHGKALTIERLDRVAK